MSMCILYLSVAMFIIWINDDTTTNKVSVRTQKSPNRKRRAQLSTGGFERKLCNLRYTQRSNKFFKDDLTFAQARRILTRQE